MPIYEYQCQACSYKFEKLQKISDVPLQTCPECGKPELAKLVSAAGFKLKGDGWYATDFKDKKKQQSTSKDTVTESKSENKTAQKTTETKTGKES